MNQEYEIDRRALLSAVEKLKGSISTSARHPGGDLVVFKEGHLVAFSGYAVSQVVFDHELDCVVKFTDLLPILKKLSGVKIFLELRKNELRISNESKDSTTDLVLYQSEIYARAMSHLPQALDFSPVSNTFAREISSVPLTHSTESSAGLFIDDEVAFSFELRNIIYLPRKFEYTEDNDLGEQVTKKTEWPAGVEYFLSLKTVKAIQNILDTITGWSLDVPQWIYFLTKDGSIFGFKGLRSENYQIEVTSQVFATVTEQPSIAEGEFDDRAIKALERVKVFTEAQDQTKYQPVIMKMSESGVRFESTGRGSSVEEFIGINVEFPDKDIQELDVVIDLPGLQFCLAHCFEFRVVKYQRRYAFVFENQETGWTAMSIINLYDKE